MDSAVKPAVLFKKDGPIGLISLNRASNKNEINAEVVVELRAIRQEIDWDSDISVVVLSAAGSDYFSNGTDPDAFGQFETEDEFLNSMSVASIIGSIDRPVIAAIQGDAFGQGLELALACDLRIASSSARLAMNQVSAGRLPCDGGTQRLARLIGRAQSLEMILLGAVVDANEALDLGLVNRVVAPEELEAEVMKMARQMADSAPIALRLAKEAVNEGLDMSLRQGLRLEADLYFLLHTTEDRAEGITAFQEKRKPGYKGK